MPRAKPAAMEIRINEINASSFIRVISITSEMMQADTISSGVIIFILDLYTKHEIKAIIRELIFHHI